MATYAAYRHVELDNVGYGKKRVLKPPGGGSSDIFGASESTSPRRKGPSANQSTLGSSFFGDNGQSASPPSSNGSSAPETPRSNKPGNDSYKRLFGPPDAPTPNSKNRMRSNIALGTPQELDHKISPCTPSKNGLVANGHAQTNGNGYHHNDVIGASTCMPRNPVLGVGIDEMRHSTKRFIRRNKDGNPVTGTGYENSNGQQNGNGSSASSEKSSTDSSPSVPANPTRLKNRVPPGGFSSGLW